MTDRRLSLVMKSREIVGVLLSPVMLEAEVTLDSECSGFVPAAIGSARWTPNSITPDTIAISRCA
jgi:hypothetical protein